MKQIRAMWALLLFAIASVAIAKTGIISFKIYGGSAADASFLICQSITDSSYVLSGYTDSYGAGGRDGWVVKTNTQGDTIWTRTYGGASDDYINAHDEVLAGGFVLVGYTKSWGGADRDGWFIRISSSGDTIVTKSIGGDEDDELFSVRRDSDGNFITCGYTKSYSDNTAGWIVKFNENGDTLWTRVVHLGSSSSYKVQRFNFIDQVYDDGYVAVGRHGNEVVPNHSRLWAYKFTNSGDSVWTDTLGGFVTNKYCTAKHFIEEPTDSSLIIAGLTSNYGAGSIDMWLVKLSRNGDSLWSRTFGTSAGEQATCILRLSEGGYFLIGDYDNVPNVNHSFFCVKTDLNGDSTWAMVNDFNVPDIDVTVFGIQDFNGDFVISGYAKNLGLGDFDFILVKLGEKKGGKGRWGTMGYGILPWGQ